MSQSNTVSVHCEAAPSDANPGGCFTIRQRLPRPIWDQMKPHAWYISADDIEDMDWFGTEPGWRYSIDAIRTLLTAGYTVRVRDEDVTSVQRLNDMFDATGQAIWKAQQAAQREAERQAVEAEKQRQEEEAARKEAEYAVWQEERLVGLVKTYANDGHNASGVKWERIAYFDGPGSWYTTGDTWYVAVIDGQTCYRRHYGNAVLSYAPQHIVDQWCAAHWQWLVNEVYEGNEVIAARKVLKDSLQDYIGADIAKRLVEVWGEEYFVSLAMRTEWWICQETLGWELQAAQTYGASHALLTPIHTGVEKFTIARYDLGNGELVQSYWRHPDGRIIAKGRREASVQVVELEQLPVALHKYFV